MSAGTPPHARHGPLLVSEFLSSQMLEMECVLQWHTTANSQCHLKVGQRAGASDDLLLVRHLVNSMSRWNIQMH